MVLDRHLEWPGTWNARDLGGLRTTSGAFTRPRRIVRSDALDQLSAIGWARLGSFGIKTILDLRDVREAQQRPVAVPRGIARVHLPIEEGLDDDAEFAEWRRSGVLATPLYHRQFLERWPDRCAAALRGIAQAEKGGVLVHCGKGCDRTGLITLLVLELSNVVHDDIAEDFGLTRLWLRSGPARALGRKDDAAVIDALLAEHGFVDQRAVVLATLTDLHAAERLMEGGLTNAEIDSIRSRLLDPSS